MGEPQLSHSAVSKRHSKPGPSSGESGEEKVKLTFGPLIPEGPESSEVVGAVTSVSWNRSTRLLPWSTT